jgi:hypothetical protein
MKGNWGRVLPLISIIGLAIYRSRRKRHRSAQDATLGPARSAAAIPGRHMELTIPDWVSRYYQYSVIDTFSCPSSHDAGYYFNFSGGYVGSRSRTFASSV